MKKGNIGIFDSGMGGISVLALAYKVLNNENFIYFGDNAFAPYGTKSIEEILNRSIYISNLLISKNCKAILIACNTATSVAASTLRDKYPLPIIAMEPALKPAALSIPNKSILVLATNITLKLKKFRNLMQKYGKNAIPIPCPELVEFVENFEPDENIVRQYLINKISAYNINNIGAIVLGCTHFIFIKNLLKTIIPDNIQIIDGNLGTVNELKRKLDTNGLLSDSDFGSIEIISSSSCDAEIIKMKRLFEVAKQDMDYFYALKDPKIFNLY